LTELPDLRSFDWILINTSSGKDSQTAMRYVAQRCKEAGVDSGRIVAVHADLGEMEWEGCPELAGKQAEHYGLPLRITKRTGGDLLEYVRRRAARNLDQPAFLHRSCLPIDQVDLGQGNQLGFAMECEGGCGL
jgi:hypothetical protein